MKYILVKCNWFSIVIGESNCVVTFFLTELETPGLRKLDDILLPKTDECTQPCGEYKVRTTATAQCRVCFVFYFL